MKSTEYYKSSARHREEKLEFYSHLTVYVLINLMLLGLNMIVTPSILWFVFPLVGWGLGLAAHGLIVFVFGDSHLKEKVKRGELKHSRSS